MAAASDRPARKSQSALHGQVFICLQDAAKFRNELPPAAAGGKASLLTSSAPLYLGLVCRRNRWDPVVYGEGIRGEVMRQSAAGDRYDLTFTIKSVPGLFSRKAEAGFVVRLKRNGVDLQGTYKGRYDGIASEGRVVGYLFRPVPSVNL